MTEEQAGIQKATWQLPDRHEAVSCWASEAEARYDARARLPDHAHYYYLTDLRGSWEVIRAPAGDVVPQ